MTTRTVEATIRWATDQLAANPHHQGARAVLEGAADGPAIHATTAQQALARAAEQRAQRPPPEEPDPGDWPPDWG